ncbi:protease inhibitor I42 family protein [Kitasatospora sp. NPDC050543]|uniref:protease inhibitor I42 family protein n=1 Tax=Kitasatospora sp. NPDC050543 TaxID=3364054 RepID=UPI00378C3D77
MGVHTLGRAAVAAALVVLVAACGGQPEQSEKGKVFAADQTSIEVGKGKPFSIRVAENPSTGYWWTVGDPQPDTAVVRLTKKSYLADPGSEDMVGAGGSGYFTFRAQGPGQTWIVLRKCPPNTCNGASIAAGKEKSVEWFTYSLTVR